MQLVTPNDFLSYGISLLGYSAQAIEKMSMKTKESFFRGHYGSCQLVVAEVWYDLITTTIPQARLGEKENTEEGLKQFLVAMYFLFAYPKNARMTASLFAQNEQYSRRDRVWKWVRKLQGLKSKVIKWPEDLEERYVVTVDGVDMKVGSRNTLPFLMTRSSSLKSSVMALLSMS